MLLVCGTWKIFLIRAKIVLNINWSVKTPLHEHMGIARFGLWAALSNFFLMKFYSVIIKKKKKKEMSIFYEYGFESRDWVREIHREIGHRMTEK